VATFVRHDEQRIVFKRIGDERIWGVMLAGAGVVFIAVCVHGWLRAADQDRDPTAFLVFLAFSVLVLAGGLFELLRSDWLVLDLVQQSYRGFRGFLLWGDRLRGPLADFAEIRLVEVESEVDRNQRHWAVAWIWKGELHAPFMVRYWDRPRSFHLARPWNDGDRLSFLRELKAIAKQTRLPLGVPDRYLEEHGVLDLPIDV
jgi:hypothetical protein